MGGRIHHIDLSVRSIPRAEALYDLVLTHIGYVRARRSEHGGSEWDLADGSESIGLRPTRGPNTQREHDRYSAGLHHLAWTARSRADVDDLHQKLKTFGATILDPPMDYPKYNDGRGYYALFFCDPDGLKLEYVWTPQASAHL